MSREEIEKRIEEIDKNIQWLESADHMTDAMYDRERKLEVERRELLAKLNA